MFANSQLMSLNLGFPDVCLTPTPAGPIPAPYPNIAVGTIAIPPTASLKNLLTMMPAHNMVTTIPISNGNEAGCSPGGVASGMFIGPGRHLMGSFKVMFAGTPATRALTDSTLQNSTNVPGAGRNLLPSQFKVICCL